MNNKIVLEQGEVNKNQFPVIKQGTSIVFVKKNNELQKVDYGYKLPLSHKVICPYTYYFIIEQKNCKFDFSYEAISSDSYNKFITNILLNIKIRDPICFINNYVHKEDNEDIEEYIKKILDKEVKSMGKKVSITDYKVFEEKIKKYIEFDILNRIYEYGIELISNNVTIMVDKYVLEFLDKKVIAISYNDKLPSSNNFCKFNVDIKFNIVIDQYALFMNYKKNELSVKNTICEVIHTKLSGISQNYDVDDLHNLKRTILEELSDYAFEYEGFTIKQKQVFMQNILFDEAVEEMIRNRIMKGIEYSVSYDMNLNSSIPLHKFDVKVTLVYEVLKNLPLNSRKEDLDYLLHTHIYNKLELSSKKYTIADYHALSEKLNFDAKEMKEKGIKDTVIKELYISVDINEKENEFISKHLFENRKYNYVFMYKVSLENNVGYFLIKVNTIYRIIDKNKSFNIEKVLVEQEISNVMKQEFSKLDGSYKGEQKKELNKEINQIVTSDKVKKILLQQNIILEENSAELELDDIALDSIRVTQKEEEIFRKLPEFFDMFKDEKLTKLEILSLLQDPSKALNIQNTAMERKKEIYSMVNDIVGKYGENLTSSSLNIIFQEFLTGSNYQQIENNKYVNDIEEVD